MRYKGNISLFRFWLFVVGAVLVIFTFFEYAIMEEINSPLINSLENTSIKDSMKFTSDVNLNSVTEKDKKQDLVEDNEISKESCIVSKNDVAYHKEYSVHEPSLKEDDEQSCQKPIKAIIEIGTDCDNAKPSCVEKTEVGLIAESHLRSVELESNRNEDEEFEKQDPQLSNDCTLEYQELLGHKFDQNSVLRDIKGNQFNFNFHKRHHLNQERYEKIGKAIDEYIYKLLESRCHMRRHHIPFDASANEPRGFFFASENAEKTEDKLLILIHGSGVVKAGQWARRIIINDNLMDGSQIPYIEQAYKEGYEVIVLNTNQNEIDGEYIEGSSDPEEHALYVWDNFVMKNVKAKRIAIMAHSYGGAVTVNLAKKRKASFLDRVSAVGFSDSVHSFGFFTTNSEVKKFFVKNAVNWVTSSAALDTVQRSYSIKSDVLRVSAGHIKHEWTSACCMKSVFKFFKSKLDGAVTRSGNEDSGSDEESFHDVTEKHERVKANEADGLCDELTAEVKSCRKSGSSDEHEFYEALGTDGENADSQTSVNVPVNEASEIYNEIQTSEASLIDFTEISKSDESTGAEKDSIKNDSEDVAMLMPL